MVIDSVGSVALKEKDNLVRSKWRDGNIWLLFVVIAVYFSISFSSRVVDYIDNCYFYGEHNKYGELVPIY